MITIFVYVIIKINKTLNVDGACIAKERKDKAQSSSSVFTYNLLWLLQIETCLFLQAIINLTFREAQQSPNRILTSHTIQTTP